MSFEVEFKTYKDFFESELQQIAAKIFPSISYGQKLIDSIRYSLFTEGKRFRPVLCLITAKALDLPLREVLPLAVSIEFIHTSSLIHDDLPSMDNDDYRRGKLTNHKVFGEAIALLAGNCLLLESQRVLNQNYKSKPHLHVELVDLVLDAASTYGMMMGQTIDISKPESLNSFEGMKQMQELKTGKMIELCLKGVAKIANLNEQNYQWASQYGLLLGLAFQIKDDLMDFDQDKAEVSFPHLLTLPKAEDYLKSISIQAIDLAKKFAAEPKSLIQLVEYNLERKL